MQEGMKSCPCPHHKVVPFLIVLIGLTFLLRALDVLSVSFVSVAWPILLILIGLNKLARGMCKCCSAG